MKKNLGQPEDPEKLLRAYWHRKAGALHLPRDVVDAAINRAERDGSIEEHRPPVRRGKDRILVGMVGLAAAAVLGVMIAPHGGKTIVVQHASSSAAASRQMPSERILAMAVSHREVWVSLLVRRQAILKGDSPASSVMAKVMALPHAPLRLQFYTPNEGVWLTRAESRRWVLLKTRNGGARWTRVALPPASRSWVDLWAVLAPGHPLALIATNAHNHDQLLWQTSRGWRSFPIRGLTGKVSTLWVQKGLWEVSKGGRLFTSADAGRSWAPASLQFGQRMASQAKSSALSPSSTASSQLWQQGLAAGTAFQGESARWVAISGDLWRQRAPGDAWRKISPLPFSGRAVSVGFTNADIGYVLSYRGVLWRTEDGGVHWMRFG